MMLGNIARQLGSSCATLLAQPPLKRAATQLNRTRLQLAPVNCSQLHTSAALQRKDNILFTKEGEVSPFHKHNEKIYPPTKPGELARPAFVCHEKRNIKYSPKKLWFVCRLIRGMAVEDAINQLKFCHKAGAVAVLDTLLEAQRMAVDDHNVEFPSNLWVAESFCLADSVIRGIRRHAKNRIGNVDYRYVRYCCTLEEGSPPEHYYYHTRPKEPQELLDEWQQKNRERIIRFSL